MNQQFRLFAGKRRRVGALADDEQVGAAIAIEVADEIEPRVDHRDVAEHGIGGVGERALAVAQGPQAREGAGHGWGRDDRHGHKVKITVVIEVDKLGFGEIGECAGGERAGGVGEKRAGFEDGEAGGGEAAGGGGERAVSATEIAGGGAGGFVQGPGGDEAGAVGGQRFAEGGGDLSGGAPDVPDAHLARIAGEGGIIGAAVGEISDADAERYGGRGEQSAGGGAGGDDRAVNEEAGGGAVFQDGGDVRPRAEGKSGGRDEFAVTPSGARGGDEGEFGAVAIELEGEADERVGAAGGEALAHEPGVGSVAGQVEPALEGERCAGGEVGGGGGAERGSAEGGDVGLRGRDEGGLGAEGGKERSESEEERQGTWDESHRRAVGFELGREKQSGGHNSGRRRRAAPGAESVAWGQGPDFPTKEIRRRWARWTARFSGPTAAAGVGRSGLLAVQLCSS